jgi:hypothetical protein
MARTIELKVNSIHLLPLIYPGLGVRPHPKSRNAGYAAGRWYSARYTASPQPLTRANILGTFHLTGEGTPVMVAKWR